MHARPGADQDAARVRALEELDVLHTGPERRFDRITRLAQRVFGVVNASITLIDEDRQHVKSQQATGLTFEDGARADAFCDHTIRRPDTLVVEDATADDRFADNPLVAGPSHLRFYAGHPLQAPGGQRVGALCLLDDQPRRLSAPERELLQDLAAWVEDELANSTELEHAAEAQRALLPRTSPELPGHEVAGMCLPSRAVGGDFYDWEALPDGDLALTVADVMGKGFAAALTTAGVRAVFRSAVRTAGTAQALREAAATLYEDLERTSTLVTVWHGRLSPATGLLRYTDAGHSLMVVVRADGSVWRPRSGGLPLGVFLDADWAEEVVQLQPGDSVLVFSDGLLDLYDGTLSSLDRVAAAVRDGVDVQHVIDRFAVLSRRVGVRDDVTAVAIRRTA
ncbi:PP2C family protein-serine/threonine phosphatase [Geodermatophilus sp. CPCC 205506]|uniref:PP2C family protein-serine/threonine phosphatase n=1 Tax=Geodermatophilus sp. CPCC 205506 TaxID=2936596 RepID=UPI003EEA72A2